MSDETRPPFAGFRSPNYTMVPDEILDELMAELSGAELKVLLYIVRRTFGWRKPSDEISLGQITKGIRRRDGSHVDHGTGLAISSAQNALKSLEERGIIVAIKRTDPERGKLATEYGLRFADPPLPEIGIPSTDFRQRGTPEIGRAPYRKSVEQKTTDQQTTQQEEEPTIGMTQEEVRQRRPPDWDERSWETLVRQQPAQARRLAAEVPPARLPAR